MLAVIAVLGLSRVKKKSVAFGSGHTSRDEKMFNPVVDMHVDVHVHVNVHVQVHVFINVNYACSCQSLLSMSDCFVHVSFANHHPLTTPPSRKGRVVLCS